MLNVGMVIKLTDKFNDLMDKNIKKQIPCMQNPKHTFLVKEIKNDENDENEKWRGATMIQCVETQITYWVDHHLFNYWAFFTGFDLEKGKIEVVSQ